MLSQYKTGEVGRYEITINGGTWIANEGNGYFVNVPISTKGDKFTFKFNLTNVTANMKGLYNGPDSNNCSENYADDATAKAFGYGFRVGETANGKVGEVYFLTKEEALECAASGVKVYDITGSAPVEVAKPCEHTYNSVVTAPTCDAEGYTTHTCSKCQNTYTDTTAAALGHSYEAATCVKKSTCSVCGVETGELARHKYEMPTCTKKSTCAVCGAERGELAKHIDSDSNNKSDNCDAQLAADADTTIGTTATDGGEKNGCNGTVGMAGVALVAALGSCALFVEKKRK
jgi:hypothetical protein